MVLSVLLAFWVSSVGAAEAEISQRPEGVSTDSSKSSDDHATASPAKKKSKGKKPREKEAEGTQAPNRFEAETFIKSRYEYNGQSLEVDTE
jgi:hypothetical protein